MTCASVTTRVCLPSVFQPRRVNSTYRESSAGPCECTPARLFKGHAVDVGGCCQVAVLESAWSDRSAPAGPLPQPRHAWFPPGRPSPPDSKLNIHRALVNVDILSEVFQHVPMDHSLSTAACVCKAFCDPALQVLWRDLGDLLVLFKLFKCLKRNRGYIYVSRVRCMEHHS